MLQVLSAVTGESIAEFQEVDFEEGSVCSVKAFKRALGTKGWHLTLPTTAPSRRLHTG